MNKILLGVLISVVLLVALVPGVFADQEMNGSGEETGNAEQTMAGQDADDSEVENETEDETEDDAEVKDYKKGKTVMDRVRNEIRSRVMNGFSKVVDNTNAKAERLMERVEAMDLSEDKKAEVISSLEEDVAKLNELKETLSDDTLEKGEIRESWNEIKEIKKNMNSHLRLGYHRLIHSKYGNVIERLEAMQLKFQERSGLLAEQGKDTTELDLLLVDMDALLLQLNEDNDEVLESFVGEDAVKGKQAKSQMKGSFGELKLKLKEIRLAMEGEE
jgi:hypothetical protein